MKYFIDEEQRKASGKTCYFEFQKGKFRNKCWLKDSLCIHANTFDLLNLDELFSNSIVKFNYYGLTVINKEQWENFVIKSKDKKEWLSVIEELTPWVK